MGAGGIMAKEALSKNLLRHGLTAFWVWFEKGSGTVAATARRVLRTTVLDPFEPFEPGPGSRQGNASPTRLRLVEICNY